ncbi:peptidoglycan-binding domain-containing protein [Paenibacillus tepidiphilus]|uniref:peptidoglycan-binding domain-containing protein n=1 Tax=Paenibacillus tepidiphilus TaxID=2608683 RepID=UPI00123A72FE|nr:peptidoglycan-binding domain-containing protein [Paenibacillus tepidiphilus]
MAAGHNNVAAVGTSASNAKYGTSYLASYSQGTSHAQVAVLKANLRQYRSITPSYLWTSTTSLEGNTSNSFDAATKANLIVFQNNTGLTADGIYGAGSRNAMHASIGVSPKGWVRIFKSTPGYVNYNDTAEGLSADATYKLDHSWCTSACRDTLYSLGYSFYSYYNKLIQVNDACLLDGADTPEHSTHQTGTEVDIRNAGLTTAQATKFLEICIANANVKRVIYYTTHGLTSNKILVQSDHGDHFHVDTFS